MIKFTLETHKGRIELADDTITLEQLHDYAESLGVPHAETPETPKASETPKTDIEAPMPATAAEKADAHGASQSKSRTLAATTKPKPEKPLPEGTVTIPASYDCSVCGEADDTTVPEWFRFIKCSGCGTKLYLKPVAARTPDDPDYKLHATRPFYTYAERQQFKQQAEDADHDDQDPRYAAPDAFSPDIMDAVYDAANKGTQALEALPTDQLKEYIERCGIQPRNPKDKTAMIRAIREDAVYQM